MSTFSYVEGLRAAHQFALRSDDRVVVIGQGLWSPWYVGASMTDLEKEFGTHRVFDTPVSEQATTGVGIGAALMGMRPIVVHPRVDFALMATDQIVNQAAKWSSMFGGSATVPVVFRCIINRGGQQGAQHSQSLYSLFAHIPGLRVVSPATAADAYDLLLASIDSPDPVVFMDDRWLYDQRNTDGVPLADRQLIRLDDCTPSKLVSGDQVTLISHGWGTKMALEAQLELEKSGISAEVIDLRVLNPLNLDSVIASVEKTGRAVAIDADSPACGIASEVLAQLVERVEISSWRARPTRITLPDAPAPSAGSLESGFYFDASAIVAAAARCTIET